MASMAEIRVIFVTGDRNWSDRDVVRGIMTSHEPGAWVLQGGARGADLIAKEEGEKAGHQPLTMDANWGWHAKAAGPIRNRQMFRLLKILMDAGAKLSCYACHDDLENSRGTRDMVSVLQAAKLPWEHIRHG